MAKSSDVGAVRVPRKLTAEEIDMLLMGLDCGEGHADIASNAGDRLAFLEPLVQDVAKRSQMCITQFTDSSAMSCKFCRAVYLDTEGHPKMDSVAGEPCVFVRMLAAVADDREEK